MAYGLDDDRDAKPSRAGVHAEDAVILLSVVALFILGVFFRYYRWGQVALVGVAIVMVVVFWRRLRRVHRAFTNRDEWT